MNTDREALAPSMRHLVRGVDGSSLLREDSELAKKTLALAHLLLRPMQSFVRTVVLDQQHEMVAGFERAALHMTRRKSRGLADRRRGAEEDALLAAEHLTLVLRERGHIDIAHPGFDRFCDLGEDRVLHLRAA